MIFLSSEDVLEFNAEIVPGGAPEQERVEALITRVLNAWHYDGVSDVYELAALYLIAISRGHVFLDGNKRTAFQSMALFLMINGVDLRSDPQLEDMTVDASQGKLSIMQVAAKLRLITEPPSDNN